MTQQEVTVQNIPGKARAAMRAHTERSLLLKLLAKDCLLDRHEAAAMLSMSAERWSRYADQWPALRKGKRPVSVEPGSRGRWRWLMSSVLEHIQTEILRPDLRDDTA